MFTRNFINFRGWRDERGTVAMTFSLAFVPMLMFVGASVDYARVVTYSARVQQAADHAAIGSAHLTSDAAAALATSLVEAELGSSELTFLTQASSDPATSIMSVAVMATMQNTIMSSVLPSVDITRSAKARVASQGSSGTETVADDSCIFTLGETLTISTNTMTFNGSPSVDLTGCSLRSNKSMKCNGSSTYATSYAVGDIVGCSNPHPRQAYMPDIYRSLSSGIELQCGSSAGGVTWTGSTAGNLPTGGNVRTLARSDYTEVHICGNLRIDGTAATSLTGAAPTLDTVVVVENGGIYVGEDSDVRANRMTFVLASKGESDSNRPIVRWPNGNGSNAGSWAVSASTGANNPWKGIALYQNPSLNDGADMSWQSGTKFQLDGILYLPNAQFTVSGQVLAGPSSCSKIIVGEFTLNGAVTLRQSAVGCANMQVTQYFQQGAPATSSTSAYLTQ